MRFQGPRPRSVPTDALLLQAAEAGDSLTLGAALEAGRCIDVRNNDGRTPLMQAACAGHEDCARHLLRCGADPNATDTLGITPLMTASRAGRGAVVQLMLRAGAQVNIRNVQGHTPLTWAARAGHLDVVDALLGAGADPNLSHHAGSPLSFALANGHDAVATRLIQAGARLTSEATRERPPHWPVLCLGPEEIRGLIQRGWDPNALDDDGSPALFRAIRAGRTAAAQVLIQCGSAVDTEDRRCDTPLKLAVLNDQPEIVAMLLAAGADPGRRWRHGLTALHVAALAGRRNVAEELTRRLPVDIPDCRRRTALMLAAWQGHASLVAMLVTAGADREARCLVGESACDYAKRSGHLDLAVVLAEGPGSGRQVAVE